MKIFPHVMVKTGEFLTWQKYHFALFMSASIGVHIPLPLDKK